GRTTRHAATPGHCWGRFGAARSLATLPLPERALSPSRRADRVGQEIGVSVRTKSVAVCSESRFDGREPRRKQLASRFRCCQAQSVARSLPSEFALGLRAP